MPSPVLSDKTFGQARAAEGGAGWASPQPGTGYFPPVTDGPISAYAPAGGVMTMSGTMTATGVLFVLLIGAGAFGWNSVTDGVDGQPAAMPGWVIVALLGALGVGILTSFKPKLARFTAPVYAVVEGLVLGAISRIYNEAYPGIVVSAVGATLAVFAVMWFLYATRIIKVTDRMRRMVVGATLGVMVLYGVSFIVRLFTGSMPIIDGSSGLSIGISLVVIAIAAFNLTLDFDMIEKGAQQGAPKYMEWYCGFGLMVTLVWLYLEILRLLSKLQNRN
jgi:uncharacterized YccA/Bax inhibitor family protein